MRSGIIDTIFNLSQKRDAFEQIERLYANPSKEELSREIVQVGIMPEVFEHDSSEEKMWSKFSDVILAACLNHLGLKSHVIKNKR